MSASTSGSETTGQSGVSNIVAKGTEAAVGAAQTGAAVQQAVSQQSDILDKIEAGLGEFLAVAPTVAGAIDPAVAGPAKAFALGLTALLDAFKQFHTQHVVPAVAKANNA